MTVVFQPWQLLWTIVVGWINEYSQRRIDYLQTELTVVKEAYGVWSKKSVDRNCQ